MQYSQTCLPISNGIHPAARRPAPATWQQAPRLPMIGNLRLTVSPGAVTTRSSAKQHRLMTFMLTNHHSHSHICSKYGICSIMCPPFEPISMSRLHANTSKCNHQLRKEMAFRLNLVRDFFLSFYLTQARQQLPRPCHSHLHPHPTAYHSINAEHKPNYETVLPTNEACVHSSSMRCCLLLLIDNAGRCVASYCAPWLVRLVFGQEGVAKRTLARTGALWRDDVMALLTNVQYCDA
jgi:hypothetical protein